MSARHHYNSWSDIERAICIAMLKAGKAYSQISARIGRSRSAVGGYICREAEIRDAAPERPQRGYHAPKHPRKPRPAVEAFRPPPLPRSGVPKPPAPAPKPAPKPPTPPPRPPTQPPTVPAAAANVPPTRGLALWQLKADECKWPGDNRPDLIGGFAFCGHPVHAAGASYCPYHNRLATPSSPRQPGIMPRERLVR